MKFVHFCFIREEQHDLLAVVDWSQKLSFYHLSGKQVGKTSLYTVEFTDFN